MFIYILCNALCEVWAHVVIGFCVALKVSWTTHGGL